MAARRVEIGGQTISFDHGAQYFTARDPDFRKAVESWQNIGWVAPWPEAGDDAFVGKPNMNGPIRAMARDLNVHWNTRGERLVQDGDFWRVEADDYIVRAKQVLIALPAEQAAILLHGVCPVLSKIADSARSEPCWAVMAAFMNRLDVGHDSVQGEGGAIRWAARNSAKPSRSGEETWVIHASPKRSRQLLDKRREDVAPIILEDFFELTGAGRRTPIHLEAHRWLYAMPEAIEGEPARYNRERRIGIAGDYLHSPRVEGAWLSGVALAEKVLAPV